MNFIIAELLNNIHDNLLIRPIHNFINPVRTKQPRVKLFYNNKRKGIKLQDYNSKYLNPDDALGCHNNAHAKTFFYRICVHMYIYFFILIKTYIIMYALVFLNTTDFENKY